MSDIKDRYIRREALELARDPSRLQAAIVHQQILNGAPDDLRSSVVPDTRRAHREEVLKLARLFVQF